jgi:hypothetical protein
LIVLPFTKCSRLIRPIVSTTSIPRHPLGIKAGQPACHRKKGSELDANYPATGSIFHAGSHRDGDGTDCAPKRQTLAVCVSRFDLTIAPPLPDQVMALFRRWSGARAAKPAEMASCAAPSQLRRTGPAGRPSI